MSEGAERRRGGGRGDQGGYATQGPPYAWGINVDHSQFCQSIFFQKTETAFKWDRHPPLLSAASCGFLPTMKAAPTPRARGGNRSAGIIVYREDLRCQVVGRVDHGDLAGLAKRSSAPRCHRGRRRPSAGSRHPATDGRPAAAPHHCYLRRGHREGISLGFTFLI